MQHTIRPLVHRHLGSIIINVSSVINWLNLSFFFFFFIAKHIRRSTADTHTLTQKDNPPQGISHPLHHGNVPHPGGLDWDVEYGRTLKVALQTRFD